MKWFRRKKHRDLSPVVKSRRELIREAMDQATEETYSTYHSDVYDQPVTVKVNLKGGDPAGKGALLVVLFCIPILIATVLYIKNLELEHQLSKERSKSGLSFPHLYQVR